MVYRVVKQGKKKEQIILTFMEKLTMSLDLQISASTGSNNSVFMVLTPGFLLHLITERINQCPEETNKTWSTVFFKWKF